MSQIYRKKFSMRKFSIKSTVMRPKFEPMTETGGAKAPKNSKASQKTEKQKHVSSGYGNDL